MNKSNLCPPQFPYHCNKHSAFRTRSNGKPSQGNASHCVQKKSMCKKSFSKVRSMMKKHRPVSKKDWHNGKPRVSRVASEVESGVESESDEELEELVRHMDRKLPMRKRPILEDMEEEREERIPLSHRLEYKQERIPLSHRLEHKQERL